MSEDTAKRTPDTGALSHIEMTGIEVVKEEERTAKPRNLFLPWLSTAAEF